MYEAIDKLADEIAIDIFIADGGVDDFHEMTEAELAYTVYHELHNRLARYVTVAAKRLQEDPA